jgi:anti-sigma B factor antagonist
MSRFEATVRHRGGVAIIDLRGELDAQADGSMRDAYAEAAAFDPRAILLSFRSVGYITSTGIALVIDLLARARKDGREVTACDLSDHYRNVFEITRLVDLMRIFPDEERAIVDLDRARATAKASTQEGEARGDDASSRQDDGPQGQ